MLAATLASGCHVVLEGPPGTGKSTLLRAVADGAGLGVEFVEGNAELTPARLVGHHDPALVLEAGYTPDTFVDGPLISALREGRLLYIEELNRVPEETLNVLVGALAEGEIHVPRLGRVRAARELPADRGDEPVRRGRHGAGQPGDRRPHVPDRDQLPGRGGRAGDRRARTARARARWSSPRSSSPAPRASTPRCGWAPRCAARSTSSGSAAS